MGDVFPGNKLGYYLSMKTECSISVLLTNQKNVRTQNSCHSFWFIISKRLVFAPRINILKITETTTHRNNPWFLSGYEYNILIFWRKLNNFPGLRPVLKRKEKGYQFFCFHFSGMRCWWPFTLSQYFHLAKTPNKMHYITG